MAARIHIGTSGWQYRHWSGVFYPEKTPAGRMFEEYLKHFDTVELNSSFYHLPTRERFEAWKAKTPTGFLFAVKASRYITHTKRLIECEEPLERFLMSSAGLGRKLGPILFQMPPSFALDLERVEAFLKLLPKRLQCTFEFRHPSWMTEEAYDLLRKYDRAFCIYELAGFETPHEVTASFVYIRLHGPGGKYRGDYSNSKLQQWADEIKGWPKTVKDVYVYFDNDIGGHAPKNALTLRSMLE